MAIKFSAKEELKALPILLRHSPGRILPGRRYVISVGAAEALRAAGVTFQQIPQLPLSDEADAPRRFIPQSTQGRRI